jgi:hypothetical protein
MEKMGNREQKQKNILTEREGGRERKKQGES